MDPPAAVSPMPAVDGVRPWVIAAGYCVGRGERAGPFAVAVEEIQERGEAVGAKCAVVTSGRTGEGLRALEEALVRTVLARRAVEGLPAAPSVNLGLREEKGKKYCA